MPAVPPSYENRQIYGPFHRREAPGVQNSKTVTYQIRSGEIWGKVAQFGLVAAVKAYRGPLPPGVSGIEFWSFQAPDRPYGSRFFWRTEGRYVTIDAVEETAKLSVAFARITQDFE